AGEKGRGGANNRGGGGGPVRAGGGPWKRTRGPAPRLFAPLTKKKPPFSHSRHMGSRLYAQRCRARNERISLMLSLETIGYYSDQPGSQHYPFPFSFFYPSTANFIAFVGNREQAPWVKRLLMSFRRHAHFPSE